MVFIKKYINNIGKIVKKWIWHKTYFVEMNIANKFNIVLESIT